MGGGVDIEVAFYNVGLPSELRRLFALPRLRAGTLGLAEVEGRPVVSQAWARPCLAVLLMGWTRALDFCQKSKTIQLEKGGLPAAAEIVDGERPADLIEGAYAAYAGTFEGFWGGA